MKFFSEIEKIFQNVKFAIAERLDTAEAAFTITFNELPTDDCLRAVLELAPKRDSVSFTLTNDSEDILTFDNHQSNQIDVSSMTDGMLPEDSIDVRIQIDKVVADGGFSIYDYDSFVTDLLQRPLPEIMVWFSRHLSGQERLIFEVFDNDVSFSTRTMAFESGEGASFKPVVNRTKRLSDCKDTACFYNMNMFEIVPDDFIIQGIVRANARLQTLFGKLSTILSLAYVSSSSSIEDGNMKVQISGQRTISYNLLLSDIREDDKWQNVFTWIYTDGNPIDKTLIAHNILSLHCRFEAILKLDDAVFEAIKTNYNLYLRNNVDKYLDMNRDIAKFIQDVVSQVGSYSLVILGKFKTNLLAMFGFLFTVVLTRIGDAQKWNEIFTADTLFLCEIITIGSLIYLIICYVETRYKLKKIREGYFALKENYIDVLSDIELNEVFKGDTLFCETEKSAKRGIVFWSVIWGSLLICAVIIIEFYRQTLV